MCGEADEDRVSSECIGQRIEEFGSGNAEWGMNTGQRAKSIGHKAESIGLRFLNSEVGKKKGQRDLISACLGLRLVAYASESVTELV